MKFPAELPPDNLVFGHETLTLFGWFESSELPKDGVLKEGMGLAPLHNSHKSNIQDLASEYHFEFFRQSHFRHYPSRMLACQLLISESDAAEYARRFPAKTLGRQLYQLTSEGTYTCSYHDAGWLEYASLPVSLDLDALGKVAHGYWAGKRVNRISELPYDVELPLDSSMQEALFVGTLRIQPAGYVAQHATSHSSLLGLTPALGRW